MCNIHSMIENTTILMMFFIYYITSLYRLLISIYIYSITYTLYKLITIGTIGVGTKTVPYVLYPPPERREVNMTGATSGSSLLRRKEQEMAGATSGSSILREKEQSMSGVTSGSSILRRQEAGMRKRLKTKLNAKKQPQSRK